MATQSTILAWKIPWTEEPVHGYGPQDCKEWTQRSCHGWQGKWEEVGSEAMVAPCDPTDGSLFKFSGENTGVSGHSLLPHLGSEPRFPVLQANALPLSQMGCPGKRGGLPNLGFSAWEQGSESGKIIHFPCVSPATWAHCVIHLT